MEDSVREHIKNYQFYDGVKRVRKLSASQVSRDLLELYLSFTEDSQEGVFGKGEIGSIFHLGMEEVFKDHPKVKDGAWMQEIRETKTLSNGWEIDGKSDMVQFDNGIVIDYKGMSASAYAVLKSNKRDHKVNMQMAIYRWLFNVDYAEVHVFCTNWDPCNATHPASAYQVFKPEMYEPSEIEEIMLNKTTELELQLASGKAPAKCEDVMPRRLANGSFINSKCTFYCSYAHVCPRKRDDTAKKLGLDWTRK